MGGRCVEGGEPWPIEYHKTDRSFGPFTPVYGIPRVPEDLEPYMEMKDGTPLFSCVFPHPFQGAACDVSSESLGDMQDHVRRAHLGVMIRCIACGEDFSSAAFYGLHLKGLHQVSDPWSDPLWVPRGPCRRPGESDRSFLWRYECALRHQVPGYVYQRNMKPVCYAESCNEKYWADTHPPELEGYTWGKGSHRWVY